MTIILSKQAETKVRESVTNFEGFIETLTSEYPKYEFYPVGDIQMSVKYEGKSFFVEGKEENGIANINNITPLIVFTAQK